MSDSTTNIDQVSASSAQKEVQLNALIDAASSALIFGRRASTTAALTWGHYGGRMNGTSVANGTSALTASTTNYQVIHRTTLAVSVSTATTNWNDAVTYGRGYLLVTGTATVTGYEDHRHGTGGILGGGGGGGAGTVTSVDATQGVETVSGTAITATGTIRGSTVVNAQTGTTYTILTGDRGKLVTHTNAASIAVTLPQAGGTFPANWFYWAQSRGAGTVTITPTTSTIDGAATLALSAGQGALIVSDGTNYFTMRGIGGSTTPGGSDTHIQYNDAGAFNGDARLAFNETSKVTTGQFAVDSNAINAQTGTSYTLVAADNGKLVTLSNAAAITLTVPSGLGAGFNCLLEQLGAGVVTITPSSTTVESLAGLLNTAGQYAVATLIARAANTFVAGGALA